MASVSGGSLTNGFVAQQLDFGAADTKSFEDQVVKPLARQIAHRGTLYAPWLSKLYLALLVLGLIAAFLLPLWLMHTHWGWKVLVILSSLLVWGWLAGKRGWMCAQAFRSTLFAPNGKTTLLRNIANRVCHVICATELRAAQSVYFSAEFAYSYEFGPGQAGSMGLYQAVQASAAFPGGFPPARLPAREHLFQGRKGKTPPKTRDLILSDGGVYDNMGDQWARGFAQRVSAWPWLKGKPAPKQLIVVNASARVPWTPLRMARVPLLGEVFGFVRIIGTMYINTTNVRRQEIVGSFDPAQPAQRGPLPGVLVQIAQSPFTVAEFYAKSDEPAVAARAQAVIAALGATKEEWRRIAEQNAEVKTTLAKLGAEVTARLLYHGYVTAMCNLHTVFGGADPELGGWRLLAVPSLTRFEKLTTKAEQGDS